MHIENVLGWFVALAVLSCPVGCKGPTGVGKVKNPDLVERSAVYTIEDGRVVRIPSYRGEDPVVGQCVEALTYSLKAGSCLEVATKPPKVNPRMLDKQGFRVFSQMLSVESSIDVDASGQKVASKVTVTKHRLFIDWNRYAVVSLDPYDLGKGIAEYPYVSAVEYGIGVRIILDVSLTGVDAESNLTFGFGNIAAAVATRNARVSVQYDTIGVPRDILPEDLPLAIESVNDITRMMMGLYGAVEKVSKQWNARVDQQKIGDVLIPMIEPPLSVAAPLPEAARSTGPEGTGDSIAGGAPVPLPSVTDELPSKGLVNLVRDVKQARDIIESLKKKEEERKKYSVLFDDESQPLIGGAGFDDLAKKVENGETVTAEEVMTMLESIEKHGEGLEKLKTEDRGAPPLEKLPESLSSPAHVSLTLNAHYLLLRGDEDVLFPRGFSAAPIAYYVARSDDDIRRDSCEDLRLSYAANRVQPSKTARMQCQEHWIADDPEEVEEAYCNAKLIKYANKLVGPGPLLSMKCGGYWNQAKKKKEQEQKAKQQEAKQQEAKQQEAKQGKPEQESPKPAR